MCIRDSTKYLPNGALIWQGSYKLKYGRGFLNLFILESDRLCFFYRVTTNSYHHSLTAEANCTYLSLQMFPSLCTFKVTTRNKLLCRVPRDESRVRLTTPPCITLQRLQVLQNTCQHLSLKVSLLQLIKHRFINTITTD